MRTPILDSLSAPLRRGAALTILSLALAAGLAGCDGAGPTEPGVAPAMDPVPLTLYQPAVPTAAARASAEVPTTAIHPICPIWRWPRGKLGAGAADVQMCATAAAGAGR